MRTVAHIQRGEKNRNLGLQRLHHRQGSGLTIQQANKQQCMQDISCAAAATTGTRMVAGGADLYLEEFFVPHFQQECIRLLRTIDDREVVL